MTLREVYPGLFLSGHTRGLLPAASQQLLDAKDIKRIVCVAPRLDAALALVFSDQGGTYRYDHVPLSDGKTLPVAKLQQLSADIAASLRAGQRTLVHCNAGRNRASLVGVLVMREFGVSSNDAIAHIRATRVTALANSHFELFLRSLDD